MPHLELLHVFHEGAAQDLVPMREQLHVVLMTRLSLELDPRCAHPHQDLLRPFCGFLPLVSLRLHFLVDALLLVLAEIRQHLLN